MVYEAIMKKKKKFTFYPCDVYILCKLLCIKCILIVCGHMVKLSFMKGWGMCVSYFWLEVLGLF